MMVVLRTGTNALFTLTLLSMSLCQGAGSSSVNPRKLIKRVFFNYLTRNEVHDDSLIDLDQKEIANQLDQLDSNGWQNALNVYKNGAHSFPYAELTLKEPLAQTILSGTPVYGASMDGNGLRKGKVMTTAIENSSILLISYDSSEVNCYVGGSSNPTLDGCFVTDGSIIVSDDPMSPNGEFSVAYSYIATNDNKNKNSIQKLSLWAESKMWECENCPFPEFLKYYNYYGTYDYANEFIMASFRASGETSGLVRAGADFTLFESEGRSEAIKMATVCLSTWMYIIHSLEAALDDCDANCADIGCSDDKAYHWDAAVAYYTGFEEVGNGSGSYLMFDFANKLCPVFDTCLEDRNDGSYRAPAKVNLEIMDQFILGQQKILSGKCSIAKRHKENIVRMMTIPLVQSTILYAHLIGKQIDTSENRRAQGAISSASILPLIHACNQDDSEIIYNHMKLDQKNIPDYNEVRSTLEKNYECLGISCADVGGIIDFTTENYVPNAGPCAEPYFDNNNGYRNKAAQSDSSAPMSGIRSMDGRNGNHKGIDVDAKNGENNLGMILGPVVAFACVAAIIAVVSSRTSWKSAKECNGNNIEANNEHHLANSNTANIQEEKGIFS